MNTPYGPICPMPYTSSAVLSQTSSREWGGKSCSGWSALCFVFTVPRHQQSYDDKSYDKYFWFIYIYDIYIYIQICILIYVACNIQRGESNAVAYIESNATTSLRMGKQEGFSSKQKRKCHDVWMKDKQDQKHLVWHSEYVFGWERFH